MQQILVYSDSASWGIIPQTRKRLPFDQRWPGVLELLLNREARVVRIVEDCLNGRRTAWDDPFKEGRHGLVGLQQRIEMNSPLALAILMLGTNDFQATHQNEAWQSAQGMARLIRAVREAPMEPGMPIPAILVIAPPPITEPRGRWPASLRVRLEGALDSQRSWHRSARTHLVSSSMRARSSR